MLRHFTHRFNAGVPTLLTICVILAACSKEKEFTIKGKIDDLGQQTVSITYYAGDGIKRETQAAVDGVFNLKGTSAEPTLCLVETGSGIEIATLIVEDGDEVKITGDSRQPFNTKVKGNGPSERLSKWTAENAETLRRRDTAEINEAVAAYVGRHKADVVSTALMVTRFQVPGFETLADSLLTIIDPKVRTSSLLMGFHTVLATQITKHEAGEVRPMSFYQRNDTVTFFNPASHTISLLAFRPERTGGRDSIVELLRRLSADYPLRRLRIYEISTTRDSASWKQTTARDSASWPQVWAPGSVAMQNIERLKVPRTPYFIVADSLGQQILRTSSAKVTATFIDNRLHKPATPPNEKKQ